MADRLIPAPDRRGGDDMIRTKPAPNIIPVAGATSPVTASQDVTKSIKSLGERETT